MAGLRQLLVVAEAQLGESKEDITDLRERNNNLLAEVIELRKAQALSALDESR